MKKTKPKPDIIYNELNETDSALDAFCMAHGTRITIIDEQIASLPDDNVNKAHLQQIRAGVERAHLARNGELLESRFETLTIGLKAALHTIPLAIKGEKSVNGHKSRDDFVDKTDFINLVRQLNSTLMPPPSTLTGWLKVKELGAFKKKYTGRDTLRNWINEALPGTLKTGRPKKHTVIG